MFGKIGAEVAHAPGFQCLKMFFDCGEILLPYGDGDILEQGAIALLVPDQHSFGLFLLGDVPGVEQQRIDGTVGVFERAHADAEPHCPVSDLRVQFVQIHGLFVDHPVDDGEVIVGGFGGEEVVDGLADHLRVVPDADARRVDVEDDAIPVQYGDGAV